MGFTKFQQVEKAEVLSSEAHGEIEGKLRRIGKKSVSELTEAERKELVRGLKDSE